LPFSAHGGGRFSWCDFPELSQSNMLYQDLSKIKLSGAAQISLYYALPDKRNRDISLIEAA
jgi:hypothetical protein